MSLGSQVNSMLKPRVVYKIVISVFPLESFHLLDQIWEQQKAMLRAKLSELIRRAFKHAIRTVNTDEWISNKFANWDAEVQAISELTPHPDQDEMAQN